MSGRPFVVRDLGEIAIRCADLGPMAAVYGDVLGRAWMALADGMGFVRIAPRHRNQTRGLELLSGGNARSPAAGAGSLSHHLALNVDFGRRSRR